MARWTVQNFIDNTRKTMDAESSGRWTDEGIRSIGGVVHLSEWASLLNANPNIRAARRSVTLDSEGRIPIADLSSGTGDAAQNFYRILTGPTDGDNVWAETDLIYVPTGATRGYQATARAYYQSGDYFQLLPVTPGLQLTVDVSWRPTTIIDLADVQLSEIDFPYGYEWLLALVSAGMLLLKGGAESQAANEMFALATDVRRRMVGDLGRRSTRPTFARFADSPAGWAG